MTKENDRSFTPFRRERPSDGRKNLIDYIQYEKEQILLSELEEYIDIEAYIDEYDKMLERSK